MNTIRFSFALCMAVIGCAIAWRLAQDEKAVFGITIWAGTVVTVLVTAFSLALVLRSVRGRGGVSSVPGAGIIIDQPAKPALSPPPTAPGFTFSGKINQPRLEQYSSTTTTHYD